MSDIIIKKIIRNYYFDPRTGYTSKDRLHQQLKSKGVTRFDIENFFDTQEQTQIFERTKRPTLHPIITSKPNHLWELDLIDYVKLRDMNDGYSYIMIIIDSFTKYVRAYPLKTKATDDIKTAFKSVFKIQTPEKIISDGEGAISGYEIQALFQKNNIVWIHSKNQKAPTAERVIRTIKNMISRYFKSTGQKQWVNDLKHFITNYNNSKHRTIGMTPNEAIQPQNATIVRNHLMRYYEMQLNKLNNESTPLNIGDKVRVLNKRTIHTKGYESIWEDSFDEVEEIQGQGQKYVLKNHAGSYRSNQLLFVPPLVLSDKLRRSKRVRT